jgi:hypothetical protein
MFTWWNRGWFPRQTGATVGLWRILFGLLLIILLLADGPNWHKMYSPDGTYPLADWLIRDSASLSIFTINANPQSIWLWYIVGLLAALAYTVGYKSRWAAVVLFVVSASAFRRHPAWASGHEAIVLPLLFLSLFLPLSASYSIDNRLRGPRLPNQSYNLWALRLMQVTIACLYFFGGLSKVLESEAWRNGSAIALVAQSPAWWRYPQLQIFQNHLVSQFLTYSTLIFELSFIALVWSKKLRPYILFVAATFHISLITVMGPGILPFNLAMLVNLILFLDPEDIKKIISNKKRS